MCTEFLITRLYCKENFQWHNLFLYTASKEKSKKYMGYRNTTMSKHYMSWIREIYVLLLWKLYQWFIFNNLSLLSSNSWAVNSMQAVRHGIFFSSFALDIHVSIVVIGWRFCVLFLIYFAFVAVAIKLSKTLESYLFNFSKSEKYSKYIIKNIWQSINEITWLLVLYNQISKFFYQNCFFP